MDVFGNFVGLQLRGTQSPHRRESNALAGYTTGPSPVYPAKAFDSRLRSVWVPRTVVQIRQKSEKNPFHVGSPQSPFSFFFFLALPVSFSSSPFFLSFKNQQCMELGVSV